jgi:23S rRNA (guanosine2251-2'-O)-methyltransferase
MKYKQKRPEQKRPEQKPRQDYLVDGLAATREYARFKPEAILEVYCKPSAESSVRSMLETAGVQVKISIAAEKEGLVVPPVQARVKLKALEMHEFEQRLKKQKAVPRDLVIAIDHITDPRNLGAIVRSAAFFGVREVIVPEKRQVLLTQASVATAQGGFALTDLVCVTNLNRTLDELKEHGYWIIGTAMDGEPLASLVGVYNKVVMVLGSEDTGLSKLVRERCDRLAAIRGRSEGLDSLNVSVAAGIFLSAFATP